MPILLLLLALLLPVTVTAGQFDNLTSCQLSTSSDLSGGTCTDIPPDNVAIPDLYDGTSATKYDGAFGAQYFRIAVSVGVEKSSTQLIPDYAKVPAWNSDGTRLLLYSNNGWWHLLNGNTYAYIGAIDTGLSEDGLDSEPRWSHSDNQVFYYRSGMRLLSYNIGTQSSTTIKTFTTSNFGVTGSTLTAVRNGDEGNPDDTDRYWAFIGQTSGYVQGGVLVYDRTDDNVISGKTLGAGGVCGAGACPTSVNWIGMSHTGGHVVINWDLDSSDGVMTERGYGTEVFDRSLNYIGKISEKDWHMDMAQLADGTDVMVGVAHLDQENGYKAYRVTRLSDNTVIRSCYVPDAQYNYHVSGRTDGSKQRSWVLISIYGDGSGIGTGIFAAENFAMNVDNCTVRRIAHTQSNFKDGDYYSEPHASMNFDFTKIVWGSNWRVQGADDLAYVAELGTASDSTPAAFSFADAAGQGLSTVVTSDNVTVMAIDNTTTLTLTGTGCEYSVNGAAFATADDNVTLNDNVALRVTSSASHNTAVSCTLNIGGVTDVWRVTTLAAVNNPQTPRFRGSSMSGGWR